MRVCKVYTVPTYHISDIQVKLLVLSVSTAKGIYYIITAPAHCRLNTVHNTVAPKRADTLVLRLSIFSNFFNKRIFYFLPDKSCANVATTSFIASSDWSPSKYARTLFSVPLLRNTTRQLGYKEETLSAVAAKQLGFDSLQFDSVSAMFETE